MAPIQLPSLVLLAVISYAGVAPANAAPRPVQITVPDSSQAIPVFNALIGLSLEQDRWTDWSGTTSQNKFFFNTMDNLRQLTGSPPRIRIGANSEDHTNFNKGVQFAQAIFPSPNAVTPHPEATNITVGDTYYQTARFLLDNTMVQWGVNLGRNNITAARLEAASIFQAFRSPDLVNKGITLEFLEIGNEPDLYMNNGLRPSTYTVEQYVKEWSSFANTINNENDMGDTKFIAGAFAGSSHTSSGFSPQAIYKLGILSGTEAGRKIGAFSEHHYSGTFCSGSAGVLKALMNKDTIRGNLSQYTSDIEATKNQGLEYILGETNSYSCHGAPGVSNTAGAALWALDYALYAASIGMQRVCFHDGIGFKYNLVQPITLNRSILDASPLNPPSPPHVQPQYYAAIVAAEAIGSQNVQIAEILVNDSRISGFAFYEGTNRNAQRMVFINHDMYLKADEQAATPRPIVNIPLDCPSQVTLKKLDIKHADDTEGLLWGGQSFETLSSNGRASGRVATEDMSGGEALGVPASSAVLVVCVDS